MVNIEKLCVEFHAAQCPQRINSELLDINEKFCLYHCAGYNPKCKDYMAYIDYLIIRKYNGK